MYKKFTQLLSVLEYNSVTGNTDTDISALAFDSRAVSSGCLFFALPGTHTSGNLFIPAAIEAGAAAVIYEGILDKHALEKIDKSGIPAACVRSARFAMSPVSAAFYDHPSKKLAVVGVTGTEGKSSTVSFIWQLLRMCGCKAGFISTVQYSLGDDAISNPDHQTTPEAPIVQRSLYEMLKNGCEYVVIECSSHGLSRKLNRLGDVDFDAGVMMNVTHEHLEFHGSYEQYRYDKANLFRALSAVSHIKTICGKERQIPSFGVVNADDRAAAYFTAETEMPVYGFSVRSENTQDALPAIPDGMPVMRASSINSNTQDISFSIHGDDPFAADCTVRAGLAGAFNAYNIMAALITISRLTGAPIEEMLPHCLNIKPVKGRMTVIDCGQPFEVIVDYAHTPSSFETIFPPIRKRIGGRIISLFGSGGERDIQKRPIQGKIAAQYSDIVILCDEDPRGEKPAELLGMIAAGCKDGGLTEGKELFIIPNRRDAIRFAVSLAKTGDAILLLGKSHENSIIYKDHVMPYDEIQEAKDALAAKGFIK